MEDDDGIPEKPGHTGRMGDGRVGPLRKAFGSVALWGILLFHIPLAAQIPSHSLQGLIVERGSSTVISGATVELSDRITILAGFDGRFRFEDVPGGRHDSDLHPGLRREEPHQSP